jgi:hypothetical protein
MSQEINSTQGTPSGAPRNNTVIYWVIIAILLAACVYMFVTKRTVTMQNEQTTTQLTTSDSSRKAIQNDYDAALGRLDQLTSKNAQMDSMINNKDGEIAKLKANIHTILSDSKATSTQLAKAREMMETLKGKVKSYEERIAELEGENKQLTTQNEVVTRERDFTVTKNIALKQLGSVLHISNIRMEAIHTKRNGKEKETTKARKVDLMRITFDIDENRITETGLKEIDVRITGPQGTILSNAAYGSGNSKLADGSMLNYTIMKQIQLEQAQPVKDVTIDWHQESPYLRGTYGIEFYNGGYKVGYDKVTLR